MTWQKGDDGPRCTCGEVSAVADFGGRLMALCFFHTGEEGLLFELPEENEEKD